MELAEFLVQTRAEVLESISDRMADPGVAYPFAEVVFAEVVMDHMASVGMTFDPEPCHYETTSGNARLRLSGYAVSEEADQLDLFVSLFGDVDILTPVSDTETKMAVEQCLRFLQRCAEGRLAKSMDKTMEAYKLASLIPEVYSGLEQIRVYVLTDKVAKAKSFKAREIQGKTVKLEVMDIERLWRHLSEGKPRDELVVNFEEVAGGAIPCIFVPGENTEYDYALTTIPGEALRFLYEKFGARLLEANVRSFLSGAGKVNKGIAETLRTAPERFMAYNNGIVLVADEMHLGQTQDGSPGISWLKGMQIVNGGQTTASLFFTKKKFPLTSLSRVRVPAKVIILRNADAADEEGLIADISKYANSQNAVKMSDLSANKPFHIKIEQLSLSTYCPDGVSRWFYERAAGSYNTMIAREGTPAKQKKLKNDIPASRKITKTDLAKFLNAWERKPHLVSFGAQKNFEKFMAEFAEDNGQPPRALPDVVEYKRFIVTALIFKTATKLIRPMFVAFQANVTAYTVATLAEELRSELDFDRIWQEQSLSVKLQEQIRDWATEINNALHATSDGRMVSEWAKKEECWMAVRQRGVTKAIGGIPEIRTGAPIVRETV
ncbi:abortive phage infection protein [Methylobacterium sp. Leaf102]|uniref:AIPR family protein n=1 Tax=Methylobacterium sp. Leaf102 TaxID=1736253 RepID=UPI0006F9D42A|nr:AIPR family protein [Methylobacterium sp. Leaf102]KQP24745.1 abortive phage infection protein [Methylobacterium sp. Leaf102]